MHRRSRADILGALRCGELRFATVSGILTTKPNLIRWVDDHLPDMLVLTTKSFQIDPTPGNREPIIVEPEVGCFGNAVGLRNPGMDVAVAELEALRAARPLRGLLNVSLAANTAEDFVRLARRFSAVADLIELNFSCPHAHAGYGSGIGSDAALVASIVRRLRAATDALLFPKLTPNVDTIGDIARAAIDAGADGLVAINTVGPEVYIEPHTQKPVLQNPLGRAGGKSGAWIRDVALAQVKAIRQAVGPSVPIIGMGGMSSGQDVKAMREAGADVVGLGSVLARVLPREMPAYLAALKEDAVSGARRALSYISQRRLAQYRPYRLARIVQRGEDLRLFVLAGSMDYLASQYAFLWIPDVGEKPFSIALSDPLTFVVRKRFYDPAQQEGLVTHALFQLKEGDELMVRGVYGAPAPRPETPHVAIVAGGTGIAVVPRLAQTFAAEGKRVVVYYGVRTEDDAVLGEEIARHAQLVVVPDQGVAGRVCTVMREALSAQDIGTWSFYNIGPEPLMQRAMDEQAALGAPDTAIYASLELGTLCGIGMCGECECGGHLTCREGTFLSRAHLSAHSITLEDHAP